MINTIVEGYAREGYFSTGHVAQYVNLLIKGENNDKTNYTKPSHFSQIYDWLRQLVR
jgi:hypothetical protein